jgi:hypothetical protein
MQTLKAELDPDFGAAQVALLGLAASAGRDATRAEVGVRILPATNILSMEGAARVLATMPKPLLCRATYADGVLAVTCDRLSEAGELERRVYEMGRKHEAETGGWMSYITDRYGAGDHLVAAFGSTRSLTVPLSVTERWNRDYLIRGAGFRCDDAHNPLAASDWDYQQAIRIGARGLIRFHTPEDTRGAISFDVLELPLSAEASPQEQEHADQFLLRSAKLKLAMLKIDLSGEVDPELSKRNPAFRAWVERSTRERHESLKNEFVPQVEEFFRGRQIPPEIMELIELSRTI